MDGMFPLFSESRGLFHQHVVTLGQGNVARHSQPIELFEERLKKARSYGPAEIVDDNG